MVQIHSSAIFLFLLHKINSEKGRENSYNKNYFYLKKYISLKGMNINSQLSLKVIIIINSNTLLNLTRLLIPIIKFNRINSQNSYNTQVM
jgi:hypothetical protein